MCIKQLWTPNRKQLVSGASNESWAFFITFFCEQPQPVSQYDFRVQVVKTVCASIDPSVVLSAWSNSTYYKN